MKNYARIIDNAAVDVSADPANSFHPEIAVEFVEVPGNVKAGWRLVDGKWKSPLPSKPEPVLGPAPKLTWATAPAEYWWIEPGAFLDRFGEKALSITGSTDSDVHGFVVLVQLRKYIDLHRSDMPQMINILVSKGIINGAEMMAVLDTPTTENERHIKGLVQPA